MEALPSKADVLGGVNESVRIYQETRVNSRNLSLEVVEANLSEKLPFTTGLDGLIPDQKELPFNFKLILRMVLLLTENCTGGRLRLD